MFERATWDQRRDLTTMAAHDAGATLWERTTLVPADVDMAQVYDGFSFLTVMWLEALGFVTTAGRSIHRRWRTDQSHRRPAREHKRWAAVGRGACTAWDFCTRPACKCGARAVTDRLPNRPRWLPSVLAGVRWREQCY